MGHRASLLSCVWFAAALAGLGMAGTTLTLQTSKVAHVVGSWPLPESAYDTPGLVMGVVRCGEDFFLLDPRMALIYKTKLDGRGERIGQVGKGPGHLGEDVMDLAVDCEASSLYAVGYGVVYVFRTDTGQYVREFTLPKLPVFSRNGDGTLLDLSSKSLQTHGYWPADVHRDYLDHPDGLFHEGARFGLKLDLSSGAATPLFGPLDSRCQTTSSCWDAVFDRLPGADSGWAFAQAQARAVSILSAGGDVMREIPVASAQFRRDGRQVPLIKSWKLQNAWNETNSTIARVYVTGNRLAVVHTIQTSRNVEKGTWIQWAVFLNVYALDGTLIEADIRMPGLPVGRDGNEIFFVDYGDHPREADAPARLVAVRIAS
jgi:hypothetical protein